MNEQEIFEKLQVVVNRVFGQDSIDLTKKTKFDELGINSFAMVQLICAIEDEFEIEIPNTAIKGIKNVPAVVKDIKKRINEKA